MMRTAHENVEDQKITWMLSSPDAPDPKALTGTKKRQHSCGQYTDIQVNAAKLKIACERSNSG
jgi:hypothetical protein